MNYLAKRPCPICSNTHVDVLHTQRFVLPEGHPLSDGYEVVNCRGCGFVYADTAVSQEAYDFFYTRHSKYEDQKNSTGGGETPWDRERLQKAAQRVDAFLGNPDAKVLDVGCANGGMLKALKDLGYANLVGIDPSPTCVENTRRLGIMAERGSLFTSFRQNEYDCAILSHTLEHVQDIRQAAVWINNILRKEMPSWVYIEVPDAARYADYVYAPFQDFNTEHINHFSLVCLKNFLRANRFEPVKWGETLMESAPGMYYPAIFSFAQREDSPLDKKLERDDQLREHIQRYVEISRSMLNTIETHLRSTLRRSPRILVWGLGELTKKLLVETSLSKAEIVAFIDSNPINQGSSLRTIPVIAPEDVNRFDEPILVSTLLHQKSITSQIKQLGLPNPIILLTD